MNPLAACALALAVFGLAAPPLARAQAPSDPTVRAPAPAKPAPEAVQPLGEALDALARKNPVLARVDGHEIRWADVVASAQDLPEEQRGRLDAVVPALLQRLIDLRLLVAAGRAAGLAEDAAVRRQVAEFEDRLVGEAYLDRIIDAQITDAMLRARYEAYRRALVAETQVRARHILLYSRAEALEVVRQLDAGADFAGLARERSHGSSAAQGGDLDYFTRDGMIPAFAEAAFALPVGEYTRTPVETEFGWHVIKVEDRRVPEAQPFEAMRETLREEAGREATRALLRDLRAKAAIELFPEGSVGN